jgi:broad specificity phosphatase PhoE
LIGDYFIFFSEQIGEDGLVPTSWFLLLAPAIIAGGLIITTSQSGKCVVRKFSLFAQGIMYLVLSRDTKWRKQVDPDVIKGKEEGTIKIVFVRHGESVWNVAFNKGINFGMVFRVLNAVFQEFFLLFTPDSVFIDSPLSEEGVEQAKELMRKLDNKLVQSSDDLNILKGLKGDSVIVASNLRRALQTAGFGFWNRIQRKEEKILISSTLQEISRNIDCLPLAAAKELPHLPSVHSELQTKDDLTKWFDPSGNTGNKPLNSNGLIRMRAFSEWAFQRHEKYIIVVGHSLWFRNFFRTFLPAQIKHIAKERKIDNCGVVAFNLSRGVYNGQTVYRVDPDSVTSIHRGFL